MQKFHSLTINFFAKNLENSWGGKFAVVRIALIYAYVNLLTYNIIGLYTPYINRVILTKFVIIAYGIHYVYQ